MYEQYKPYDTMDEILVGYHQSAGYSVQVSINTRCNGAIVRLSKIETLKKRFPLYWDEYEAEEKRLRSLVSHLIGDRK